MKLHQPSWRGAEPSPSNQSCSTAKARQAASIRLYRWYVGSSDARSASCAQLSAFSKKCSDCFIPPPECREAKITPRKFNAVEKRRLRNERYYEYVIGRLSKLYFRQQAGASKAAVELAPWLFVLNAPLSAHGSVVLIPFLDEAAETEFLLNRSRRIARRFNGSPDFIGRHLPVFRPIPDVMRVDVMADWLFRF